MPPLGLILCAGESEEKIELLQLDRGGIRVASYLTELPPRPLLQKKLAEAVLLARSSLDIGPGWGVKQGWEGGARIVPRKPTWQQVPIVRMMTSNANRREVLCL